MHQQRIGQYLRLRTLDAAAGERLARFLEDEALRIERTASLLARARAWLRDEHVLAPADSTLRRAVGAARHKARALLTQRMAERLSAPIDGEILRFAALQLGADAETIHAYAGRQQTVSEHQQRIGEYLRLRAFDAAAGERLVRFLEDEALRLERTASLLARARAWLRDEHVLAPADSVLRRAIGAARHKARTLLTQRMAERLSAPMRDGLSREPR